MKGYLIHEQQVSKQNAKIQIQIKLPSNIEKITGVLAVIDTKNAVKNVQHIGDPLDQFKGAIWLRIPERRDVFYADDVIEPVEEIASFKTLPGFGFDFKNTVWISAGRPETFRVDIPVQSTLIEGFYEDASSDQMNGYKLKIYLETHYD